jgi:hypothetical protein
VRTLTVAIGFAILALIGYQDLLMKRWTDSQAAAQYVQEVKEGKHDGYMPDGHTLCIEGLDEGCKAVAPLSKTPTRTRASSSPASAFASR